MSRNDERVRPGDRIEVTFDSERRYRAPSAPAPSEGYRVVHEDDEVVVADKAAGVFTVPAPSQRGESLAERLEHAYRARGYRAPLVRAVHRIDRFTSGLVAFARREEAWRKLRTQFAAGLPERVYLAVAEGNVGPDDGLLVHHLEEHEKSLKVRAVARSAGSKRAESRYRVLERFDHATLLEVRLRTGRRNQIRVQLAAEGHPLVGDHAYGRPSPLIGRTALHAARLAFDHPSRGSRLELASEPPADFRRLLSALRRGERADGAAARPAVPDEPEKEKRSSGKITRRRGPERRCT